MAGCKACFLCTLCLLSWFVFNQQNIHCKILRRIAGVVKLQRIILKSMSTVSEQEILLKIEKKKRWAECADEKHVNNVTFGVAVCFNCCQTSNVWPGKHVLSGTLFRGGSGGRAQAPPPPTLFLDQTEAWKAAKNFFETPPPLTQGLDDRLFPPYLKGWICHKQQ